jgi:GST-like protein
MIDFFTSTSPTPQKVWLLLEELGLEYRPHKIDVWKGGQFSDEFVKMNPNRKVPVLVDQDGPDGRPVTLFESGAILIYLAEKHGQFLPAAGEARYDTIKWLMFQMASIGPMLGQFNHFQRYAPPDNAYSKSRYTTEAMRLYELLDNRLGEAPYLAGDDYTIADIATFPWIRSMAKIYPNGPAFCTDHFGGHPHLWRWFDAIAARPAAQRLAEQVNATPSSIASATPDDHDRFFQRGRYARA